MKIRSMTKGKSILLWSTCFNLIMIIIYINIQYQHNLWSTQQFSINFEDPTVLVYHYHLWLFTTTGRDINCRQNSIVGLFKTASRNEDSKHTMIYCLTVRESHRFCIFHVKMSYWNILHLSVKFLVNGHSFHLTVSFLNIKSILQFF